VTWSAPAKEKKSFTAKHAENAKEKQSFTAEVAKAAEEIYSKTYTPRPRRQG
jgi:hypothetical protein